MLENTENKHNIRIYVSNIKLKELNIIFSIPVYLKYLFSHRLKYFIKHQFPQQKS